MTWDEHMRVALALAAQGPRSLNPQVGCVIVDASGDVVGRGFHSGAGTAHAEVVALSEAGPRARGATAVVTLEPCRHTGRTGPCTTALMDAGIVRVVYAQTDPTQDASGGETVLRDAGIDVVAGVLAHDAQRLTRGWTSMQLRGRPHITLKCAMSMDGRVSGPSGGPTPITGEDARSWAHAERARTDAIIVGTGTVLADNPALTARLADGSLAARQPLRVVVGTRPIPETSRVLDETAPTLLVQSNDPRELMRALVEAGVQDAIVEGGPTLAGALVSTDLVDSVVWLIGPMLLGAGLAALPSLPAPRRLSVHSVVMLGADIKIEGTMDVHGNS